MINFDLCCLLSFFFKRFCSDLSVFQAEGMTRQFCMGFEELHGLEMFRAVEALEGSNLLVNDAVLFEVFLVLKGLVTLFAL